MKLLKYFLFLVLCVTAGLAIYFFYPDTPLPKDTVIDKIVVLKSERKLKVYSKGKLIKTYRISLGLNPVGAKRVEGDMKTPEGIYYINGKNPKSSYYKNLGISYPNNADRKRAKALGKSTGGDIKIHGFKTGSEGPGRLHLLKDWTHGCIALMNEEVDELYDHTAVGTPIEIKP